MDGNGQFSGLVGLYFFLFSELPSSLANLEMLQMGNIWNSGGYEYEDFFLRRKQVVIFELEDSLYGFL